jgi:DUF4097 and DUF4098 domain-containing protein YvlB
MRRSSLVGPLILIAIGILFLARNLYPDLPLMDFLARYWPFLLIGWGILRLAEILFWAATSRPLPSRGMSGGEWVLVVFLVMIGWSMWAGHEHGWLRGNRINIGGLEMFGEPFDFPLEAKKAAVGKTPQIVIESFRGNARVLGADIEEVQVTGRKSIRALQRADADKADKNSPFEIVANGSQIIIRTNQDRAPDSSRVSADLEIKVPKGASLSAVGRYGDFDVNDLSGGVEIVSDNAGIRLQNIGGNVRIDTRRSDIVRATGVKGSVDLKGRGTDLDLQDIAGPVTVSASYVGMVQFRALAKPVRYEAQNTEFTAERVPGQVRITLSDLNASDIVGPVRVQARSKDVQMVNVSQSVEIALDRGDVEIRPGTLPLGKYDVRTRSGDIEFAIPEKAQLDLSASTDRGEISNDFGSVFQGSQSGHGASLKGTLGSGPRVVLSTSRGTVNVRKSSGTEQTSTIRPALPTPVRPPATPPPPAPQSLKPVEQ